MDIQKEAEDRIIKMLTAHKPKGALIPGLMKLVSDLMLVHGDRTIASEQNQFIVLWSGVSDVFAKLIIGLIAAKKIFIRPVDEKVYYSRNLNPGLPLATARLDLVFETPHWFPVVITLEPCGLPGPLGCL